MYDEWIRDVTRDPYKLLEIPPSEKNEPMIEVIPGIYLGTSWWYQSELPTPHIIFNMATELEDDPDEIEAVRGPVHIRYHKYNLLDSPTDDLEYILRHAVPLINEYHDAGKRILIHCHQGKSRSFSLLAAYLYYKYHIPVIQLIVDLHARGWRVAPNPGYAKYLLRF